MELIDFKLRDSFMDSFYNENLYDGGTLVIHINNEEIEKLNKLEKVFLKLRLKYILKKLRIFLLKLQAFLLIISSKAMLSF